MGKCLMYAGPSDAESWYETVLALSSEPSSVVRTFKILCFPPNKKGEVSGEDFELLQRHGHIGEGRLQVVDYSEPQKLKTT